MTGPDHTFGEEDETGWDIMHHQSTVRCPITPVQVVSDAFDAIAGTLYNKQKPDPSIASNARSNSLYSHRPTKSSSDEGRIGIEIDNAELLFPVQLSANRAQRILALLLAAKLSNDLSWNEYENECHSADSYRPIALSFNTIKEALLAHREMQILQRDCHSEVERDAFNHVIIQTVSEGLPKGLFMATSSKKKHGRLKNISVNPRNGLLIIVQPTDFNQDFDPARPSINLLDNFQKMTTRALIQETPVIILSPRFLSYSETEAPDNEIYQSGFQKVSYYGGKEPPRGPSPFLLRDFSPPSYCWVGDALSVESDKQYRGNVFAKLILTNSVMDENHPWHIYASSIERRQSSGSDNVNGKKSICQSVYLASTGSASGRPTRALMNMILTNSDFNSDNSGEV